MNEHMNTSVGSTDTRLIREFFDWLANAFLSGNLDWLERTYVYPMSIFIGADIRVETSTDDTRNYVEQRRADLLDAGVTHARASVIDINRKSAGRLSVRVRMTFFSVTDEIIAENDKKFLCRVTEDRSIQIESIEFFHVGVPFSDTAKKELLH